jgi:hypothetical protein
VLEDESRHIVRFDHPDTRSDNRVGMSHRDVVSLLEVTAAEIQHPAGGRACSRVEATKVDARRDHKGSSAEALNEDPGGG